MKLRWQRKQSANGDALDVAWAEVELGDGWTASYRVIPQGGRPVFGELRIFPTEAESKPGQWSAEELGSKASLPPGGLTADIIRRISIGDHRKRLAERYDEVRHTLGDEFFLSRGIDVDRVSREARTRPGPEGRGDAFYARVAAIYVEKVDAGNNRPIADLARELDRSIAYVRDVLHDARQRGLLSRARRGRAGGRLTAKGRRALGIDNRKGAVR